MVSINVYAPTKGTDQLLFLDTLGEVISQCESDEYLFLGGDFNSPGSPGASSCLSEATHASNGVL